MKFYNPATAPSVFDIVWCKWPRREDKLGPGPWVRCVLVLAVTHMLDQENGVEFADITAAYGTGFENIGSAETLKGNLYIPNKDFEALGLHKPTVFKLDLANRKRLPWSDKYFVPKEYVRNSNIIAGTLNEEQQRRLIACFESRGLKFPLPL